MPGSSDQPIQHGGGVTFEDTAAQVLSLQCTTAVRGRKLSRNIHEQSLRAARALARDPDWRIPTAAAHGGTLDRLAHP